MSRHPVLNPAALKSCDRKSGFLIKLAILVEAVSDLLKIGLQSFDRFTCVARQQACSDQQGFIFLFGVEVWPDTKYVLRKGLPGKMFAGIVFP